MGAFIFTGFGAWLAVVKIYFHFNPAARDEMADGVRSSSPLFLLVALPVAIVVGCLGSWCISKVIRQSIESDREF